MPSFKAPSSPALKRVDQVPTTPDAQRGQVWPSPDAVVRRAASSPLTCGGVGGAGSPRAMRHLRPDVTRATARAAARWRGREVPGGMGVSPVSARGVSPLTLVPAPPAPGPTHAVAASWEPCSRSRLRRRPAPPVDPPAPSAPGPRTFRPRPRTFLTAPAPAVRSPFPAAPSPPAHRLRADPQRSPAPKPPPSTCPRPPPLPPAPCPGSAPRSPRRGAPCVGCPQARRSVSPRQ